MASMRGLNVCLQRAAPMMSLRQLCSNSIGKRITVFRSQAAVGATRSMTMGPTKKQVTTFDKRILVWNGSYPSIAEVPTTVSYMQYNKAKDWFRIRVSLLMLLMSVFGCVLMVISGKQAVARGESVAKMNVEFHRKAQADRAASAAAANAK